MIRPAVPMAGPWKPRTWAAAMAEPRYGSSPAPSTMRPQRGSRAMSSIGAKAQWMPTARASAALIACAFSTSAGSQDAASAMGTGKMVRNPWMTSKPKRRGIFSRVSVVAMRCRRLISCGSFTNSREPTRPARSSLSGSALISGTGR